MSQSSSHYTLMTKEEKGSIADQRKALIKLNEGLTVGCYKAIYQVKDDHNKCIMRDCQAEACRTRDKKHNNSTLTVNCRLFSSLLWTKRSGLVWFGLQAPPQAESA